MIPFALDNEKGVTDLFVSTFSGFVLFYMFFDIKHKSSTDPIFVTGSMRVGSDGLFISSTVDSVKNLCNSLVPWLGFDLFIGLMHTSASPLLRISFSMLVHMILFGLR